MRILQVGGRGSLSHEYVSVCSRIFCLYRKRMVRCEQGCVRGERERFLRNSKPNHLVEGKRFLRRRKPESQEDEPSCSQKRLTTPPLQTSPFQSSHQFDCVLEGRIQEAPPCVDEARLATCRGEHLQLEKLQDRRHPRW